MSDSSIITRCPQCKTSFRVTSNQLVVANGMVRCGSCLAVFKALDDESITASRVPPGHKTVDEKVSRPSNKQAPLTARLAQETKPAVTTEPQQKTLEELINDSEDESAAFFREDIDDRGNTDKSNANLFERNLKPASQQLRKNTDERWASDMLAELEDNGDNVQSFKITRKPKTTKSGRTVVSVSGNTLSDRTPVDKPFSTADNPALKPAAESKKTGLHFGSNITADTIEQRSQKVSALIKGPDQISNEEIENAIRNDTSYSSDSKRYLSRIEPAPVELEWLESKATRRWLWNVGAIVAGLTLVVQVAIFRFETLSKSNIYRPFYQKACTVLGCQLPELVDIDQIRATNLVVRSHPDQKGALIVDAILLNTADFQQPYPGLKLEFSDLNEQLIAARILQPRDYLRGELVGATQMPSRQPVQLSLEIVDPGADNYQLIIVPANSNL